MNREEELILEEKDLYNKLNKIKEERELIKQQKLEEKKSIVAKKIQYIRENRDIILPLFEHSRTSCSDDNVCNGYSHATKNARCNKCWLIEILDGDYVDGDFDVEFDININFTDV